MKISKLSKFLDSRGNRGCNRRSHRCCSSGFATASAVIDEKKNYKIATAVFQVSSLILFKTPAEKDVLIKLHICTLNLIITVFVSSN